MTSSDPDIPRRFALLVNGTAGSSDPDVVERVRDQLARSGDVVRWDTTEPADLDAVLDDLDGRVLVVAGGDGSLHAAVRRARDRGRLEDVVLGLVPLGTGNDLARTLGVPLDPEEAASALGHARPRRLDLLTFDDGVAVNAVHAGIGADAAERAQPIKDRVGALAYPVGAVAASVMVDGWDLEVEVDGRVLRPEDGDRTLMVAIGNGATIGGGTRICPDADPGDGRLDVLVSRSVGPAARSAYGTALLRGEHVDRADVVVAQGERVVVRGAQTPYNVDGELIGSHDQLAFTVDAGAWTILAP